MKHINLLHAPSMALNQHFSAKDKYGMQAANGGASPRNYELIIKDEFASDEDHFDDFELDLSAESDLGEAYDFAKKPSMVRKNKRKALTPQRAIQSETSQTGSLGNCSESSQDVPLQSFQNSDLNSLIENDKLFKVEFCSAAEDEDLQPNIDEDIFKDLQDDADGESIDKNILDNVKEEWRSHWGVKCNVCEKVFPYKAEFEIHYRTSYNTDPVYTCSFCNRTLDKYSTFRSHCYRHITESRYKCKDCPKAFSLQSLLHVHVLAKHTRAKPFMCEECGKSFVTKPGLKIHLKKHKNKVKEDYPCVECGKVLHTRGGLTSHMNVHRLGRRFMCDVCGKTFTQKVNMQQHAKQHTGDKPHRCDKCGKTFAEKSHLARHYSFHSEHRPYKCEICQKMYKTERCLKVHSMVHAKERPYICTFCSKGFLSSTKLKQHYNIHTGERPYACKYCERKFTNYPNWLKHTRRRHNVDHKTGENLPPRIPKPKANSVNQNVTPIFTVIPKDEPPPTPTPNIAIDDGPTNISDLLPTVDVADPPSHDNLITDFMLSKTDELLLQQGLLNFPVTDDKNFLLQQHVDLFTAGANGGLFVPYFPTQVPAHAIMPSNGQSSSQVLLNDFVPIEFIQ